jgi:MYXO-CTERM domain-containing protein
MKINHWLPGRAALLCSAVSMIGAANAAFVYSESTPMTYDGAGDDSGIDPFTVTSDPNGDVNVLTSLTVQSGTLTIAPNTSWGDKVGHSGTGSVIVNGGTLNWRVDNDNEDRLMLGNGATGNATITLNGGDFNVTGPGGYDHAERNVRFGSDGASSTLNLTTGDFTVLIDIPVAFGGKWTTGGTTFTNSAGTNLMNIDDGWFVLAASSVFGVGNTANINFLTGGTGGLSIFGWTESQFAALATAGQLQIDGVDQGDLSGFSYSLSGGQGNLTLVPEPGSALLGGLGLLAMLRRRRS